jgi:hypothetical protein
MKESYVQRQILDYLALKGIFHYRNNSGAMPVGEGPGRRFIRFGTLGSPDIVCVINGHFVGIEVKAPKGKWRDSQVEFQKNLEPAGGRYILAYSLDDVMSTLS